MGNASLDWLENLPDLRVTGVPGVPDEKSVDCAGTPIQGSGVPHVPSQPGNTSEHLIIPQGVPDNPLQYRKEHREHREHAIAGNGLQTIDSDHVLAMIAAGIERLQSSAAPRIGQPDNWSTIVADAARLLNDGWAMRAIGVGWHPLQLFGCSPAIGGDLDLEGLAVWIDGRKLLLIDDKTAIAALGARRFVYHRRPCHAAVFLWDLCHG